MDDLTPPSLETNLDTKRPSKRVIISVVVFSTLLAIFTTLYLVLRPGYRPLFTGLKPTDARAVIAELEAQKIPFRVDEANGSILVPENDARAARVKLMENSLHLNESVGLELFDDSNLGLTDFAQNVNYQRALQGELARTIMSLDEVDMARVHLTLPASSLFRSERLRPKASVALFARQGEAIRPAVVRGIQRLVAASVPELSPTDVAVLDAQGAILPSGLDDNEAHQWRVRSLEEHLADKIIAQLRALLPDVQSTVTVNVEMSESTMVGEPETGDTESSEAYSTVTTISRITVSALLNRSLDDDIQAQALKLIETTAGLNAQRGDQATIVIQAGAPHTSSRSVAAATVPSPSFLSHGALITLVTLALIGLVFAVLWSIRRHTYSPLKQREKVLTQLRRSLAETGTDMP